MAMIGYSTENHKGVQVFTENLSKVEVTLWDSGNFQCTSVKKMICNIACELFKDGFSQSHTDALCDAEKIVV